MQEPDITPICPVCRRPVEPGTNSITLSGADISVTLHNQCWEIRTRQLLNQLSQRQGRRSHAH